MTLRLSLQTAVRLKFVNSVNIADIQITLVSENYEDKRLNINSRGGVCQREEKEVL